MSPRLNQHASGVVLGVTQIVNGLDDPVVVIIIDIIIVEIINVDTIFVNLIIANLTIVDIIHFEYSIQQMVAKEVAKKFASSHFSRGVKKIIKG